MRAAAWAEGKSATVAVLPPSTLYLLASPSVPPEVAEAVLAEAESGKPPKTKEVKQRIAEAKPEMAVDLDRDAPTGKSVGALKHRPNRKWHKNTLKKKRRLLKSCLEDIRLTAECIDGGFFSPSYWQGEGNHYPAVQCYLDDDDAAELVAKLKEARTRIDQWIRKISKPEDRTP